MRDFEDFEDFEDLLAFLSQAMQKVWPLYIQSSPPGWMEVSKMGRVCISNKMSDNCQHFQQVKHPTHSSYPSFGNSLPVPSSMHARFLRSAYSYPCVQWSWTNQRTIGPDHIDSPTVQNGSRCSVNGLEPVQDQSTIDLDQHSKKSRS